jgi:hypothetical protein
VLLVTVYLSLDLSNPLMPGVAMFAAGESVTARQAERVRGHDDAPIAAAMRSVARLVPLAHRAAIDRTPSLEAVRAWPREAPRARSHLSASAPRSEDLHRSSPPDA